MSDLPALEDKLPRFKAELEQGRAMVFKFFDLKINTYNDKPGLLTRHGEPLHFLINSLLCSYLNPFHPHPHQSGALVASCLNSQSADLCSLHDSMLKSIECTTSDMVFICS